MRDFQKLLVWRRAHALSIAVHDTVRHFPRSGLATTKTQLIRAAESIPTNIVEGCGAATQKEFARYLDISIKSSNETEYHLMAARDLGALDQNRWQSLSSEVIEIRRMAYGLRNKVINDSESSP